MYCVGLRFKLHILGLLSLARVYYVGFMLFFRFRVVEVFGFKVLLALLCKHTLVKKIFKCCSKFRLDLLA